MIDISTEMKKFIDYLTILNFKTRTIKSYSSILNIYFKYLHNFHKEDAGIFAPIKDYLLNIKSLGRTRLKYIKDKQEVSLLLNDYKNQISGMVAPKAIKTLLPINAIHLIMQHVLPPQFRKSRSYGLHNASPKINAIIPDKIKRNPFTIRTITEIITHLRNALNANCILCGHDEFTIEDISKDKKYVYSFILRKSSGYNKSPPTVIQNNTTYIANGSTLARNEFAHTQQIKL